MTYPEHQVIPLGDDVAEGTSVIRLTERDATVHTAGSLLPQSLHDTVVVVHLLPVSQPLVRGTVLVRGTLVLHKTPTGEKKVNVNVKVNGR